MSPDDDGENERGRALVALRELRAEVAVAPRMEARRRKRVFADIDEIEALLQAPTSQTRGPRSAERLERLALEFEVSHPDAAALVSRLANLLASMGI
jgi:hypothetical protein